MKAAVRGVARGLGTGRARSNNLKKSKKQLASQLSPAPQRGSLANWHWRTTTPAFVGPGVAGESGSIVSRRRTARGRLSPMAERYSQLPGLLAQRERAALGLLRNGYDWRLSLGMRFQFAHIFLRPDTPSSHLLFLCHSDSLQFGRGRLSRPWRFTSNFS